MKLRLFAFILSNYWILIFLIFIPYLYYLNKKSLVDLSYKRKWLVLVIRSILILLIILSIAEIQFISRTDRLCTIFVLDKSNSIPNDQTEKALEFIKNSLDLMKEDDLAGLVVFGKDAYVEIPPKFKPIISRISSEPDQQYTNINKAIISSISLFPPDMRKRIILLSDGNENMRKASDDITAMLKANEIQLYTVPLQTRLNGKKEVFISNITAPSQVNIGKTFEIKAILVSNVDTKTKLKLFRNNIFITEKQVDLSKSEKNIIAFPQVLNSDGKYTYKIIAEPEIDTLSENNHGECFVKVSGKTSILYYDGNKGLQTYLPQVLSQKGIELNLIDDPMQIPTSLAELQNYKAIIFDNVPSNSLTNIQMQMIERYVHDLGGGFLMIGGINSFGVGGYYDTPIEKLMPVKMIPEKKKRSVSIVLLIDKSGSMNALSGRTSKIELAKESAISITEILTDKDKIGVIAFDAEAEEIVKLQGIQEKSQIIEKIGKIRARGGTNFYPALKIANEWLMSSDTQLNHVIIISDGQSLQMDESLNLAKQMARKNITISTVSISDEADIKFMQEMANIGSGRYYETTDASNLPNILIKEALMSSDLIVEQVFRPMKTTDSDIFNGINTKSFPVLLGYIQTSSKKGSDTLLTSDQGDPILSTWQYGLGKSVAFTSDLLPKWSLEWLKWNDFSKFWSQALEWCLPAISNDFDISTTISGNETILAVDAVDASGKFRNFLNLQANIVKPDLTSEDIILVQSGIGRYEGNFDTSQIGTYMISVSEIVNGVPQKWQNTGFIVSYSPEYTDLESNTKWLQEIADTTGGRYDPSYKEVFGNREHYIWRTTNIWKWLLILAIPLFFLDIIIRRITVSYEQITELLRKLSPSKEINEQRAFITERLKSRKEIAVINQIKSKPYEYKPTQNLDVPQISYTSKLLEAKKRAESLR